MPGNHGELSVDEQNGGGGDNDNKKTRRKKKKRKDVKEDDMENGDQLAMPSISKTKKRFVAKIKRKPKSPKRYSSPSRSGSRKGSCFRPSRRTNDPSASPPSDPNDESFTPEMLRVMLETNDFCSNDCNPHR